MALSVAQRGGRNIYTDCASVITFFRRGLQYITGCSRSAGGLWRQHRGRGVSSIRKTTAHRSQQGAEEVGDLLDWWGNHHADAVAKRMAWWKGPTELLLNEHAAAVTANRKLLIGIGKVMACLRDLPRLDLAGIPRAPKVPQGRVRKHGLALHCAVFDEIGTD